MYVIEQYIVIEIGNCILKAIHFQNLIIPIYKLQSNWFRRCLLTNTQLSERGYFYAPSAYLAFDTHYHMRSSFLSS